MSEWISVEDRLPSDGEYVIVFYDGIRDKKMYEDGIFYDGETHCYCPVGRVDGVTHWMPLPEPPKQ